MVQTTTRMLCAEATFTEQSTPLAAENISNRRLSGRSCRILVLVLVAACTFAAFRIGNVNILPAAQTKTQSRPVCNPWESDMYADGEWKHDPAKTSFPYETGPDADWHPRCDKIQEQFKTSGQVPNYLAYSWMPRTCSLAAFDPVVMCEKMDGATVGVAGDSTSGHFAHSIVGQTFGKVGLVWSHDNQIFLKELCPNRTQSVKLAWLRMDFPPSSRDSEEGKAFQNLTSMSTVLVMNWGVHYQPDEEARQGMEMVSQMLVENWPPRAQSQMFWRETIVAHSNCDPSQKPLPSGTALESITHGEYFQKKVMEQQRKVHIPMMQDLGANVLRVSDLTLLRPDGHRWQGHNAAKQDCLHYCEPGPPDVWVQIFFNFAISQQEAQHAVNGIPESMLKPNSPYQKLMHMLHNF